jgi:hypothetical protein
MSSIHTVHKTNTQLNVGFSLDADILVKEQTLQFLPSIVAFESRKILIVSEDDSEVQLCQRTLENLNCQIQIANSLPDVIAYSQRFFDWVLISNQVRSFGINFITLLFTYFRANETRQPQQFLFANEKAFPNKQMPCSLLHYQAIDGLMVFRGAA